jgi:hypothetical protein
LALNHYLIGGRVVMLGTCEVVDPLTGDKTKTDPTTVTFTREKPDGSTVTYTLASAEVAVLAVGITACTVELDQAGREVWRYQGTGTCAAVAEDAFLVEDTSL